MNEPNITFRYTRHQVARGARPDAIVGRTMYLIKKVSEMRLTYQVRLLAYRAHREQRKLIIRLPPQSQIAPSLKNFIRANKKLVAVERF